MVSYYSEWFSSPNIGFIVLSVLALASTVSVMVKDICIGLDLSLPALCLTKVLEGLDVRLALDGSQVLA